MIFVEKFVQNDVITKKKYSLVAVNLHFVISFKFKIVYNDWCIWKNGKEEKTMEKYKNKKKESGRN